MSNELRERHLRELRGTLKSEDVVRELRDLRERIRELEADRDQLREVIASAQEQCPACSTARASESDG